jgi:hypothetical protein
MKKTSSLAFVLIMFATFILSSCDSNGSKKGKWSEADKSKFYSEGKKALSGMLDGTGIDTKFADQYTKDIMDCLYEKSENTFSSYAELEKNDEKFMELGKDCIKDIVSKYIKKAAKDMESYQNSGSSGKDEAPIEESTKKEGEELEDY